VKRKKKTSPSNLLTAINLSVPFMDQEQKFRDLQDEVKRLRSKLPEERQRVIPMKEDLEQQWNQMVNEHRLPENHESINRLVTQYVWTLTAQVLYTIILEKKENYKHGIDGINDPRGRKLVNFWRYNTLVLIDDLRQRYPTLFPDVTTDPTQTTAQFTILQLDLLLHPNGPTWIQQDNNTIRWMN
jgi:hypothetical protein